MIARLLLLPLCLLLALPARAATVLVLGDSLSAAYGIRTEEGWVSLLAHQYPDHRFINASVSGETSREGLDKLPALLAQHQPDILVVELGANDGLRGLPLPQLKSNLQQIIDLGKQARSEILLLGVQIPPNYGPRYTREFAALYASLASANSVALVPFFLEAIASDPAHFQADQLHPTANAQPLILATVKTAITPMLERHGP